MNHVPGCLLLFEWLCLMLHSVSFEGVFYLIYRITLMEKIRFPCKVVIYFIIQIL